MLVQVFLVLKLAVGIPARETVLKRLLGRTLECEIKLKDHSNGVRRNHVLTDVTFRINNRNNVITVENKESVVWRSQPRIWYADLRHHVQSVGNIREVTSEDA